MSSISSNFFFIFLPENLLNKIVLKQKKSNLAKLVVICSLSRYMIYLFSVQGGFM